ncbi:Required for respiratory growth protein 9 mitochondrial [Metarhizium rileyi]|uniref:Required for respiratory growth protein 9, mitochondrial n=1 Tax=Metarhizium rileyi (strain RCEF 4871) TaxID=1649241 RepID=A0A5C6GCV9_METRR|nr:Required for respiratory growth protein 9 mitochondrial [Metarhizium rileyi]
MKCLCRTTAWRSFVQSLAQVHNFQISTKTARLWRPVSVLPSVAIRSRGFTTSFHWRQKLRESAVVLEHPVGASKGTTDEAEPAAEVKPQRKNRKRDRETKSDPSSTRKKFETKESSSSSSPKRKYNAFKPRDNAPDRKTARPKTPDWKAQKAALKEKFPQGWLPRKRLSPDALVGIRALHAQFPETFTTSALADKFQVSPESIRRILRSNWTPSVDEEQDRQERWFRRGMQVWERKAAIGVKPPRKWRREGIVRDSTWHERKKEAARREQRWEEEEKQIERARRNYGARSGDGEGGNGGWS